MRLVRVLYVVVRWSNCRKPEYDKNTDPGDAVLIVKGVGNYGESVTTGFKIVKPEDPVPEQPANTDSGYAPEAVTPKTPAKLADVEQVITTIKNDEGGAGTTYSILQLKGVAKTSTSIKISWTKVKGAKKYIVYGNRCGKSKKFVKLKTLGKSKTSWTQKSLKKGTYYKYIVVAVKGSNVLAKSKSVHVATNGGTGRKGNAVSIKLNKASFKVKVGKTYKKLKATVTNGKLAAAVHRKVAWESDNINVATVNSKGQVKGVAKGTCYVYAYAQNGLSAKVKVTVK